MHAPYAIDFIRYAATVQGNYAIAMEAAERSAGFVSEASVDMRGGQMRAAVPWLVNKTFGKSDKLLSHEPRYSGRPYLDGIWAYALRRAYVATGVLAKQSCVRKLTQPANALDADVSLVRSRLAH